jgi:UDP-N-acetylglucosamine--N-acetylmuramyl-(pentapeptide) pyrophosphoryl-undecaprenol N-acetylglucosamine transferase
VKNTRLHRPVSLACFARLFRSVVSFRAVKKTTCVLLAGGGTGGHIYPNVAIAERLHKQRPDVQIRFFLSNRPGDTKIVSQLDHELSVSPVQPLPPLAKPWRLCRFLLSWWRAVAQARALMITHNVAVVVATGGYVSGPAIVAASKLGIPRALVNLDAIPGKANQRLPRYKPALFSVYETPILPAAKRIGLPLRGVSVSRKTAAEARTALGLDPDVPVLFITGATHGAESIIRSMMALAASSTHTGMFAGWQVFHQCGTFAPKELQTAYDNAGVRAKVVAYCDQMGNAWRAATLAVSRAGAGSVAEAWANATPTIFLPNPYHRDQHQRHNAQPLVDAGGALMIEDRIDPQKNLTGLGDALAELMSAQDKLEQMHNALRQTEPDDGAAALADWVCSQLPVG